MNCSKEILPPSARAISAIQLGIEKGIYHRGTEDTKVGFNFGVRLMVSAM